MKTFKEKLRESNGGTAIYYFIFGIISFSPLTLVFHFNPLINILIVAAVLFVPVVGPVVELAMWVWSFIVSFSIPTDGWMIFYYVTFGIYFLTKAVYIIYPIIIYAAGVIIALPAALIGKIKKK